MKSRTIPKQFSAVQRHGKVREVFLLRKQTFTRLTTLGIFTISMLGFVTSLILGLLDTYERYYRNGPAVIIKHLWGPVLLAVLLLSVSFWAAWAAYSNWNRAAVVYDKGLAYSDARGVQVWSWEHIKSIRSEITHPFLSRNHSGTIHRYFLVGDDGSKLVLDDRLEKVDVLASLIMEQVTPKILRGRLHEFQNGLELAFGPIQIHRSQGLCVGGKRYPWNEIQDITLQRGMIRIQLTGSEKNRRAIVIPAAEVPNLEVFFSIVDRIPGGGNPNPDNTSSAASG